MDMRDLLVLASHEREDRPLRYTTVPFIDYRPKGESRISLAPAGSVMVYVGHKGSSTLKKIREAAQAGDGSDVKVAEELYKLYKDTPLLSPHRAFQILRAQPVIASIRYGGRTLATNVMLRPEFDTVFVASPFNGGRLRPDELTLVEHYKENSKDSLEAVAIRRAPNLTAAERAALEQVPSDQLEGNLAPNGSCCDNITDIVQVVIAVTFALACDPVHRDVHISEADLKKLSPTATAIQLMDIRREALTHVHQ
jgi:hypothetical protein